jgi:microcystin-dependent protein
MATPYLGELRVFSFGFAPRGWATCNGQLLPINQNQALFAILGTTFGGDGTTTFALPNLQGRVPMHASTTYPLGDAGGEDSHELATAEIPGHTHQVNASTAPASTHKITGNVWATTSTDQYSTGAPTTTLNPDAIASTGSGKAHENRPPTLGLNICIALVGIFPSRS